MLLGDEVHGNRLGNLTRTLSVIEVLLEVVSHLVGEALADQLDGAAQQLHVMTQLRLWKGGNTTVNTVTTVTCFIKFSYFSCTGVS